MKFALTNNSKCSLSHRPICFSVSCGLKGQTCYDFRKRALRHGASFTGFVALADPASNQGWNYTAQCKWNLLTLRLARFIGLIPWFFKEARNSSSVQALTHIKMSSVQICAETFCVDCGHWHRTSGQKLATECNSWVAVFLVSSAEKKNPESFCEKEQTVRTFPVRAGSYR